MARLMVYDIPAMPAKIIPIDVSSEYEITCGE
jgi:hypothetical protein